MKNDQSDQLPLPLGVYPLFPGTSLNSTTEATESISSFNTFNTFEPPNFEEKDKDNLFRTFPPKDKFQVVSVGSLSNSKIQRKDSYCSTKRLVGSIILLALLAIGGATAYLLTPSSVDFCAEFGISDGAAREIIADIFIRSIESDFELIMTNEDELTCLPENVFSELKTGDLDFLILDISVIEFNGIPIKAIHPNAFNTIDFLAVQELSFIDAPLTSLPNDVFDSFIAVETLFLNGCSFQTLDNNIMGRSIELTEFFGQNMPNLEKLPGFLQFQSNLVSIFVQESSNLVDLNPDVFADLNDEFQRIFIAGTAAAEEDKATIAETLGITENQIDNGEE